MGFLIEIPESYELGRKHFEPEHAEQCGWHKIELAGPISQNTLDEIRKWLIENINQYNFIYREIFFCCSAWFVNEEDAVRFKMVWG